MNDVVIEAKNLKKYYKMGETIVKALRGANIKIKKGSFVFIVGPSGSGKSTLMHLLGALDHPTGGSVKMDGKEISKMDDWELSMIRRNKVGFIFQTFNLVPSLTALDNVKLPLLTDKRISDEELTARAIKLLKVVGLGHRIYHTPNELSGGERQRVAIARALINNPEIILADEPTGELDSKTGAEIFELMRKMNKEEGKTFIIVTHDTEYIKHNDTVYHIKDGVIKETSKRELEKNGMKGKKEIT
ncbi:MAG: ABC transporter ATP-binding protein [Candidatus Diapherotrites archaeon]|nr:ABC transporter ATP-binding protein [Candidatus Diapherotrites archaeon]